MTDLMLITPSLLDSFHYYMSVDDSEDWAPAVREDFLRTLRRERSAPNEAMQAGIDFEAAIQKFDDAVNLSAADEDTPIAHFAQIVSGGFWQEAVKKQLGNYLLYGKIDVIKGDTAYDIKRTSNYETGKYYGSAQWRTYLLCTGLPKFEYLISDGRYMWKESYSNNDNIEAELRGQINEFEQYLKNDPVARELYETNWKSK